MVLKHALRRSFADLAEKIYNININETSSNSSDVRSSPKGELEGALIQEQI